MEYVEVLLLIALVCIGIPVVLGILLSKFFRKMVGKGRLPSGYDLSEFQCVLSVYAIALIIRIVLRFSGVV